MSIAQPSANQVANIYQGNPGALNARIQQDQKGRPGLPPDLTKLMALNIDTNEQDAAKRQQAMAALQSMQQQGGGEPPTVAQTIQQQAMQKAQLMQQQMQQMQPKPQGLMALLQARGMPQAPESAPRPDRQPSGIDELQSNVGENFDGGGIVAFDGGGQAEEEGLSKEDAEAALVRMLERTGQLPQPEPKARPPYSGPRQVTQKELAEEYNRKRFAQQAEDAQRNSPEEEARRQALISQIPTGGQTAPASNRRGEESELDRNISNTLAALPGASVTRAPTGIRALAPMLAALFNKDKQETEAPVDNRAALNASEQRMPAPAPSNRAALNAADAESRGLPGALRREAPPRVVTQRPPVAAAPVAPAAPSVAAPSSALDKFLESALRDPAAMRDESIQRMAKAYGDPDTSAQEKYIKQLDESRARFAEPTDFEGRLSRWARNTAGAGGRSSLETGSKGAAATYAEQQANAQRNMDILKELMGETSKVADIKRGYKKELFGFGEKTYDDAYKVGMDAAKELKLDARQAQLFAHQSAENALQRANAIKVAGMPGADQREFMTIAKSWLEKPENKGKTLDDAFVFFANAKQGYKPEQARVGMIEKYAKDWSTMEMMDKMKYNKDGINNAEDYVKYMMRITEQAKPGASVTGAPITKAQYDALPKGASYTAPDGSQRIKG